MVQSRVYTKDELKNGVTTELMFDFEAFVDDLGTWLVKYLMDHNDNHNVKGS